MSVGQSHKLVVPTEHNHLGLIGPVSILTQRRCAR
jgi:hypothetical protein